MTDSFPQFGSVSSFTSAGTAADPEVLYLGALGPVHTYSAGSSPAAGVLYLGALYEPQTFTALGPVLFRSWGGASLTSLWEGPEVVFGGSDLLHVYRPSWIFGLCSRVNLHDIEQIFAESTPHALCLIKGTVHADPGADIPVVGTGTLRQGILIVAHGLDFSAYASCLVKGWETANGQVLSSEQGLADCRAHPQVAAILPADWVTGQCLEGELPGARPAAPQNYVF